MENEIKTSKATRGNIFIISLERAIKESSKAARETAMAFIIIRKEINMMDSTFNKLK